MKKIFPILKMVDLMGTYILVGAYILSVGMYLIYYQDSFEKRIVEVLQILVVTLACRFGTYSVLWVQLKNSYCTKRFMYRFIWFSLIISLLNVIGIIFDLFIISNYIYIPIRVAAACAIIRFVVKNKNEIDRKF